VIGLGGGELHHNRTHWRSLLSWWKVGVPNGNVLTIQRLCAAYSVRLWWAARCLTKNLPTSTGEFADGCDPSESNWAGHPLYRPRDNLAILHEGLAKLVRMSTRNM
jgi:hypothetical protein